MDLLAILCVLLFALFVAANPVPAIITVVIIAAFTIFAIASGKNE